MRLLYSLLFGLLLTSTLYGGTMTVLRGSGWIFQHSNGVYWELNSPKTYCSWDFDSGPDSYGFNNDGAGQITSPDISINLLSPISGLESFINSTAGQHFTAVAGCSGDMVVINQECVSPPCLDDDTVLLIDKGLCSGSFVVGDLRYTELYWQVCDNTCRGIGVDLSCLEIGLRDESFCNEYTHDFNFNCTEPPLSYTSNCTRKINPCDTEYNKLVPPCEASGSNKWLSGFDECEHNGLYVTKSNWQCLDDGLEPPKIEDDCFSNWNEVYNPTTQVCDCKDGYVTNSFGDCAMPLPVDATPEEEDLYNEEQQDNNNLQNEEKQQDIKDSDLQNSQESQENTLSGLRTDLSETNDLLEEIRDNTADKLDLNDTNDLLSDILSALSLDNNTTFESSSLDFISDEMGTILNKYTFDFTSGGCATIDTISTNFHGQELIFFSQGTVDLLPMSAIKALIIFMFTISALTLVFRSD